jgi:hypothetical protein
MKRTSRLNYILAGLLSCLLIIFIFLYTTDISARTACADTSVTSAIDTSDVLDDLNRSTINGKPFALSDYGKSSDKDTQVLTFVEYCFSYYANAQDNYALYVYVYNPHPTNYNLTSNQNKIQFSVAGGDYQKYAISFLSASTKSGYENVFLKYKVVLTSNRKNAILSALESDERVYNVSGIELLVAGDNNATDYPATGEGGASANNNSTYRYIYTGYAAGYGQKGQTSSTLSSTVSKSEGVGLDVKHTFYRTTSSATGADYSVQIDTVYFAVPNYFFDSYGILSNILAEWYEYKTKEIAVTSNKDFYDRISKNYIGDTIPDAKVTTTSGKTYTLDNAGYDSNIYYGLIDDVTANTITTSNKLGFIQYGERMSLGTVFYNYYDFSNMTMSDEEIDNCGYFIPALYYLFYTNSTITNYDPYAEVTDNGGVSSNELYDYIMSYNKTHDNGYLDVKDGKISADLFEDNIDEARKIDNQYGKVQKGYSYLNFDVDTNVDILAQYNPSNGSYRDNKKLYGIWKTLFKTYESIGENYQLPVIQILNDSDVAGTTTSARQTISDTLCVNYSDVKDLQNFYNENKDDSKIVMLRFAVSDYYACSMKISYGELPTIFADKAIDGQAYIAQESVFLDFDVIQLTFNNGEVSTIIPAVSNPIDIVNAITPPNVVKSATTSGTSCIAQTKKALTYALVALGAVIILILLIKVIKLFSSISTSRKINKMYKNQKNKKD